MSDDAMIVLWVGIAIAIFLFIIIFSIANRKTLNRGVTSWKDEAIKGVFMIIAFIAVFVGIFIAAMVKGCFHLK